MVCGRGLLPYAVTHLPPAPARAGTSVPAGAAGTAFPWQQADGRTDCRHLPCTDTSAWWEPSGAAGPGLHRPLVATSPDSLARLRPPPPGQPQFSPACSPVHRLVPSPAPSVAWCPRQGPLLFLPPFSRARDCHRCDNNYCSHHANHRRGSDVTRHPRSSDEESNRHRFFHPFQG